MKENEIVLRIFSQLQSRLNEKLIGEGFRVVEREQSAGQIFIIWVNDQELAIRLSWQEKESWFIIEESPLIANLDPSSWADICIVPCDPKIDHPQYDQEIVEAMIQELN